MQGTKAKVGLSSRRLLFFMAQSALMIPLCLAQTTPVALDTVSVNALRLSNRNTGQMMDSLKLSPAILNQNLNIADQLYLSTPALIRQQGPGMLATVALRGGTSSQTTVLWEGFNINSPFNGQVDFNLLPSALFGNATLLRSGNTALAGSGSMTAVVNLQGGTLPAPGIFAEMSAGSFGFLQSSVSAGLENGEVNVLHRKAENNFPYFNEMSQQTETRSNAALEMLQANAAWRMRAGKNQFKVALWLGETNREIPSSIFRNFSNAHQQDRHLRTALTWQRTLGAWTAQVRQGLFYEELQYVDPASNLNETYKARTLMTELELRRQVFGKAQLVIGGLSNPISAYRVGTTNMDFNNQIFAIQAQLNGEIKGWRYAANLRAESNNGSNLKPAGGIGVERTRDRNTIKGFLSANYRFPTLNDLYWPVGGNPDLKPERGYSAELSWLYASSGRAPFKSAITIFNNWYFNRLHWAPENGIWFAKNQWENVWSGVELSADKAWKAGGLSGNISAGWVIQQQWYGLGLIQFTQLAYGQVITRYRNFSGQLNARYSPWNIYESTFHYNNVLSIHLKIAYRIKSNIMPVEIYGGIDNLLNQSYSMVRGMPMPGIHFNIGARVQAFTFKNSKSNQ